MALVSPCSLHQELQRIKDPIRCAELGAEVPGHRQEQLTQTLIVFFVEDALVFIVPIIGPRCPPLLIYPTSIFKIGRRLFLVGQKTVKTCQTVHLEDTHLPSLAANCGHSKLDHKTYIPTKPYFCCIMIYLGYDNH